MQENQPEKWNLDNWFLKHDNIPAHSALSVHEFLAKNTQTVIPLTRFPAV